MNSYSVFCFAIMQLENILVRYRNIDTIDRLYIVDFGVSKVYGGVQRMTVTVIGTEGYIAPEVDSEERDTIPSYDPMKSDSTLFIKFFFSLFEFVQLFAHVCFDSVCFWCCVV